MRLKKCIILLLVTVMCSILQPSTRVMAFATITSGYCGEKEENVRWSYDEATRTLTFDGNGKIVSGAYDIYKNKIDKIVVGEGITALGYACFEAFDFQTIILPNTLESIENASFHMANFKNYLIEIPESVTEIETQAFLASNLKVARIKGNPEIQKDAFGFVGAKDFYLYFENKGDKMAEDSISLSDEEGEVYIYGTSEELKNFAEFNNYTYIEGSNLNLPQSSIEFLQSDSDEYEFTGDEIKPLKGIYFSGEQAKKDGEYVAVPLLENIDYNVEYVDNINPGQAKVRVTGIGFYSGKKTIPFTIYKNLNKCNLTLSINSVLYNGKPQCPEIRIQYGEEVLTKEDYSVSYANNIEDGIATVTVTGRGNYKGTLERTFSIYKNEITSDDVLLEYVNVIYSGTEKTPAIVVKHGKNILTPGTDYVMTYSNNIKPGEATVCVVGKGCYKGVVVKNYTIDGLPIDNAKVTLSNTIFTYDGSEKKPQVSVVLGEKFLTEGIDYIVKYSDNINEGTAKVSIIAKGIYANQIDMTFTILPYSSGMDSVYDVNDTFVGGNYLYTVMDDENFEVEFTGPTNKNNRIVVVPATVSVDGVDYKVTSIGEKAFYKNSKITTVIIGNNVKNIENYAFYGCRNLKTIKFGKNVDIIGTNAFRKCTKLASVTLPKSIDSLGRNAFYGCSNLKKVIINSNSVIDVYDNAIKGISKKAVIKVPTKLLKRYYKELNSKTGFKKTMQIKKI